MQNPILSASIQSPARLLTLGCELTLPFHKNTAPTACWRGLMKVMCQWTACSSSGFNNIEPNKILIKYSINRLVNPFLYGVQALLQALSPDFVIRALRMRAPETAPAPVSGSGPSFSVAVWTLRQRHRMPQFGNAPSLIWKNRPSRIPHQPAALWRSKSWQQFSPDST